jgi:nicotinamide-nucleotide amidase
MEHLLLTRVIPHLQERYGLRGAIVSRLLRVVGMGESLVGERLADLMTGGTNPTVGTMAHYGQVDVRIAAKAADEDSARALIVPVEAEARRRLGDVVFGTDADSLEGVVGSALVARRWTLALLEAGTGGSVAQRLTAVADGGPRIEALVGELGWSARRVGATDERAGSLAAAVRAWADTDVGAAIVIGAAEGPGPNPVYPAWTGVATSTGTVAGEHRLGGDPRQVRIRAQVLALDRLRRALLGLPL